MCIASLLPVLFRMAALRALVLLGLLGFVAAECPNACSGHGDCTAYDKCSCYRNWQAADCSQRKYRVDAECMWLSLCV